MITTPRSRVEVNGGFEKYPAQVDPGHQPCFVCGGHSGRSSRNRDLSLARHSARTASLSCAADGDVRRIHAVELCGIEFLRLSRTGIYR